jgi:hypothetical protein
MTEEHTPFKKKKFDESLIDNADAIPVVVAPSRPKKRITVRSTQRTLAGIAISIRPRLISEVMTITGITLPHNALRMLQSIGAVKMGKAGQAFYYGAPHLVDKPPLDPVAMKYDDWLLGKGDWPEELGPSEDT